MDEEQYFLRCTVRAHGYDVRAVKSVDIPFGGFVSGSRDCTVKVWKPNENDSGFTEMHCMTGPTHFISCICTLPPSTQYPHGLILAGSNDCAIYGFSLDVDQPVLKLLGHSGTVCSLVAGNFGTIVSGSWDKTARVWLGQKCVMVLEGHQEAIWAVEMFSDQALILTGSADKTIRLWRSGKCEKVFSGHEDCVRKLAVLSSMEFLSCSNDSTVRLWQTNGNCVQIYFGHSDYIYGLDILNSSGDFVTCSEDQTLRLWKNGICVQVLRLPAKSLWAVTVLKNEDIAVGGSDGTIRVFTKHKELKAAVEELKEFKQELNEPAHCKSMEMIGDLKVEGLPTLDILNTPGSRDGQTVICKDKSNVCVYQWCTSEQQWSKLGDVIDANDKKKVKYDGQDYDYVFSIDVEDGKYLKLPYNISEDPWLAAQKFIDKHNLNQMFLDQIANFIINNSQDSTNIAAIPQVCDPFTGESRYIPDSDGRSPAALTTKDYSINSRTAGKCEYFPLTSYLTFDITNLEGLKNKLNEFSNKVVPSLKLDEEEIQQLLLLVNFPEKVTDQQMASLEKVMSWPQEYVFPALDLFRLAVRSDVINEKVSEAGGLLIANHLLKFLSPPNPPQNKMLVLRTFCNFFGHAPGESLLKNYMEKIISDANSCLVSANKQVQIAVATLYINYAVALNKSVVSEGRFIAVNVIEAVKLLKDSEAVFRIMVCIGTLLLNPVAKTVIESSDIKHALNELKCIEESKKVKVCAECLLKILE